jgi:hypothetical protein
MHYRNLEIIKNIKQDTLIGYTKSEIILDSRYLASYRPVFNFSKIILILTSSFTHYVSLYEFEKLKKNKGNYTKNLIIESLNGLKILATNPYYKDHIKDINKLYENIDKSIKKIDEDYNFIEEDNKIETIEENDYEYQKNKENCHENTLVNSLLSYFNDITNFLYQGITYIKGLLN